jgi:hypothetical protein
MPAHMGLCIGLTQVDLKIFHEFPRQGQWTGCRPRLACGSISNSQGATPCYSSLAETLYRKPNGEAGNLIHAFHLFYAMQSSY